MHSLSAITVSDGTFATIFSGHYPQTHLPERPPPHSPSVVLSTQKGKPRTTALPLYPTPRSRACRHNPPGPPPGPGCGHVCSPSHSILWNSDALSPCNPDIITSAQCTAGAGPARQEHSAQGETLCCGNRLGAREVSIQGGQGKTPNPCYPGARSHRSPGSSTKLQLQRVEGGKYPRHAVG